MIQFGLVQMSQVIWLSSNLGIILRGIQKKAIGLRKYIILVLTFCVFVITVFVTAIIKGNIRKLGNLFISV